MTERRIQQALFTWCREKGQGHICPNFTPPHWWECDLFSITGAGMMLEFEIKLSRADFFADRGKTRDHYEPGTDRLLRTEQRKHDLLKAGKHAAGPAYFYFVAPDGIIPREAIPSWAGHIEVRNDGLGLRLYTAKRAPKRHSVPVADRILQKVKDTFYWRYWFQTGVRDPGGPIEYQI